MSGVQRKRDPQWPKRVREAWAHAGSNFSSAARHRRNARKMGAVSKAMSLLRREVRKLWTSVHSDASVLKESSNREDTAVEDWFVEASGDAKIAWTEVNAWFTEGVATRRYLKELLPRDAWEGSIRGEETERNCVDVDAETLKGVANEVTLYVAGTRALSAELQAQKDACKECEKNGCGTCLKLEEDSVRWWSLEDVIDRLGGSWAWTSTKLEKDTIVLDGLRIISFATHHWTDEFAAHHWTDEMLNIVRPRLEPYLCPPRYIEEARDEVAHMVRGEGRATVRKIRRRQREPL